MRLAIICNTLAGGKGGAERVATDLAHEMSRRGYVVGLVYEDRGETAYPVFPSVSKIAFKDDNDLSGKLEGFDPDLAVVFYFNRRNLVRFVRVIDPLGVPLVLQECTNPDRLRFRNWRLNGMSMARACWEREVVTSRAARLRLVMPSYAKTFTRFQQSQIYAFANGARMPGFLASPDTSNYGKFNIVIVNGFKENKNLGELLLAFSKFSGDFLEWNVRVVGKLPDWGSLYGKEIAQIINANNISSRVCIEGPVEDIYSVFAGSHIHVIPSLSEGCPTVVLEAMATGLPSVGFLECAGTNELISHGRNGLLVHGSDRVDALSEALRELIENKDMRRTLGENAFRDAKAFEPSKVYDKWERLIKEAAGYSCDGRDLVIEQSRFDRERTLHARRVRRKVLES